MSGNGNWCVVLDEARGLFAYGPMDQDQAEQFADFLTREVDPARARRLIPPEDELIGWWRRQREAPAQGASWPPQVGDVWQDKTGDRWLSLPGLAFMLLRDTRATLARDDVARNYGPLTLVTRTMPRLIDEEPPF